MHCRIFISLNVYSNKLYLAFKRRRFALNKRSQFYHLKHIMDWSDDGMTRDSDNVIARTFYLSNRDTNSMRLAGMEH